MVGTGTGTGQPHPVLFVRDLGEVKISQMTGELICPVAMELGMRFAIREGGRTIGAGVVSKIIE